MNNKKIVIAALLGALTFDQAVAARLEDDSNLLELEDDADFGNDDFQELDADLDSYAAPAKKPAAKKAAAKPAAAKPAAAKGAAPAQAAESSEDESTSDDERHEAYKDGDRNSSQS